MKQITQAELLELFDSEVHAQVALLASLAGTSHIVVVENEDMCSSHFGARSALAVGPGRTFTFEQASDVAFRTGDVPSRFQYPRFYCEVSA